MPAWHLMCSCNGLRDCVFAGSTRSKWRRLGREGEGMFYRQRGISERIYRHVSVSQTSEEEKGWMPVVGVPCRLIGLRECGNTLALAAQCRDSDGLSKTGEALSGRRSGFGSESTDPAPDPERKRKAPVVGIPCAAAADLRTAGIRMEAGGDACWLTRQLKEVKSFGGLEQPLDSPQVLSGIPVRLGTASG